MTIKYDKLLSKIREEGINTNNVISIVGTGQTKRFKEFTVHYKERK